MSNELSLVFEGSPVRFIPDGDSFWVVGVDLLKVLEYAESSLGQVNNVFAQVPQEWKGHNPIMTPGGEQQMLCLSEQGLYFFLGRSDKPKALPYQRWIAGEVVPSIRKTGQYSEVEGVGRTAQDAVAAISAARLVLEAALDDRNQIALGCDEVHKKWFGYHVLEVAGVELPSPEQSHYYTPTELGKMLDEEHPISAKRVNSALKDIGFHIMGPNKKWIPTEVGKPYSKIVDVNKSYSHGTTTQLKWTIGVLDILKKEVG